MNSRNGLATNSLAGFMDSADGFSSGTNGVASAVVKAAEQAKSAINNQVESAKAKIEQATTTAKAKIDNTMTKTGNSTANTGPAAAAPKIEIDSAYKSATATISGVVAGSVASVLVYKNRKKKGLLVPALAGVAVQGATHVIAAETIKRTR